MSEVRNRSGKEDILTCTDEKSLCACSQERFYSHISRDCKVKEEGKMELRQGMNSETQGHAGVSWISAVSVYTIT